MFSESSQHVMGDCVEECLDVAIDIFKKEEQKKKNAVTLYRFVIDEIKKNLDAIFPKLSFENFSWRKVK